MWGLIMAACGISLVAVSQTKSFRLKMPVVLVLVVGLVVSMVNIPASGLPDDEACGSGYLAREC